MQIISTCEEYYALEKQMNAVIQIINKAKFL